MFPVPSRDPSKNVLLTYLLLFCFVFVKLRGQQRVLCLLKTLVRIPPERGMWFFRQAVIGGPSVQSRMS